MSAIVLVFLALIPAIGLLCIVYVQDKKDKEPKGLIVKTFIFGVLCTIPAIIMEVAGELVLTRGLYMSQYSTGYVLINAFVVVAVSEETCKMFAAKFAIWKRAEFDHRFDGIVYCVSSALGFAALENVLYVFQYSGSGSGMKTVLGVPVIVIARALLSIPTHAVCGMIVGYFFGLAKEKEIMGDRGGKTKFLWLSILIPAIEHGIYDGCIFMSSITGEVGYIIFDLIFVIAVDIWAIIFIRKQAKADRRFREEIKTNPYAVRPNPFGGFSQGPGYYMPGYGANPAPGYGVNPAPGYGVNPAPGYSANPAPGYGVNPAPGYGANPAYNPNPGYNNGQGYAYNQNGYVDNTSFSYMRQMYSQGGYPPNNANYANNNYGENR